MARHHAISSDGNFRIPRKAFAFEGFGRWAQSGDFPETGRIDYLEGDVDVDMSPEDLQTHGLPKGAIFVALHTLITGRTGEVYTDRARITSRFAGLSAEPDVVVILWESLKTGKVRYVPASSGKPDRSSEIEGAPDLVVEILSDSSERKDTKRLPLLYARAGIPELWLVDARKTGTWLQILTLDNGEYVRVEPDLEGWVPSPQLGAEFRLQRRRTPVSTWYYTLENRNRKS